MKSKSAFDNETQAAPTIAGARKAGEMSIFERYLKPVVNIVNPRVMGLAGRRWSPTASVLTHRGRRSGRIYATPVSALPRGGFFWIGLAFGEDAGWARNVVAAGECELRYRGIEYRLVEPVVFDRSAVSARLPFVLRFAGPLVGIRKILRMRGLPA